MAQSVYYSLQSDAKHTQQMREDIREAKKVLTLPQPDTFLGRKTHEPFPRQGLVSPADKVADSSARTTLRP